MFDKFVLDSAATGSVEDRISQLDANQERLYLLCTALGELLISKGLVSEAEMLEKLTEIDLRDGLADGKFSGIQIVICPQCGNKTKARHRHCIYCGESLEGAVAA